jgi:hypothetical protein
MLAGTRFGKVEHHRLQRAYTGAAVAPQVRPMRLAVAWQEHGHRRFIGMQHCLPQQRIAHDIDQRLQLHAAASHPLCQRGIRNCQASTFEDAGLAIFG